MNFGQLVDDLGSGKPWLVMVHAMSQNHRIFRGQVDGFRADYRVLLIDLPGHGLAGDYRGPVDHTIFAEHVRDAMRHHDIEKCLYWGTHTGASLGLLLATKEPDLFSNLILEGPVRPGGNPPIATKVLSTAIETTRNTSIEAGIEQWWQTGPWFDVMRSDPERYDAAGHLAIIKQFNGELWLNQKKGQAIAGVMNSIAEITIPSLIYNGEFDHPDFLTEAHEIGSRMPKTIMVRLPNCGGFPCWENPKIVNKLVQDFIASQQD